MAYVDMPLDELRAWKPDVREPADFDEFWTRTLAEHRAIAVEPTIAPADSPITTVDIFDVTFGGFNGDPIKGWLWIPKDLTGPAPAIVEFQGYGGGRQLPHERLAWASSGFVHFFMDTRGQGSGWGSGGETPDPHGSCASVEGVMTKGIESPADYYYRRMFVDGVRAVDLVRSLPQVDASKVFTLGGSQGGGASLAVGSLMGDQVAGVMADVPFLCHYERACGLVDTFPYQEIVRYLRVHRAAGVREMVFDTLSYFDGVNFAKRIRVPSIVSVALMDATCPASTVFAACNHMPTAPQVEVYEFNNHEGGEGYQWLKQVAWANELLGRASQPA